MVPQTYLVEYGGIFYGPFATAKEAFEYADAREYMPFSIYEIKAP